jgi:hypothetical protein
MANPGEFIPPQLHEDDAAYYLQHNATTPPEVIQRIGLVGVTRPVVVAGELLKHQQRVYASWVAGRNGAETFLPDNDHKPELS